MVSVEILSIPSGAKIEVIESILAVSPADMLILVSPQYKDDNEILSSIQRYIDAVKADIGWTSSIVKVTNTQNSYAEIGTLIKEANRLRPLKACLVVGEDIGQAWSQSVPFDYRHPYCWVSESIGVAFLMPNSDDIYHTKKSQLVQAFNKFSINRNVSYGDNIFGFIDATDDFYGTSIVEVMESELPKIGSLKMFKNTDRTTLESTLTRECKLFAAVGHAFPHEVHINQAKTKFYATDMANIKTQLVVLSGCWTNGWKIPPGTDKDTPYPPTKEYNNWFGHTIFGSTNIKAIVAGFPIGAFKTASHDLYDVGFVCTGMDDMKNGKTIAEAIGSKHNICTRNVIYGDPTFHF